MKKLEMKDFLEYKYISRLEYAPGGMHAAFVVTRPDWDENGYKSDIWVLDTKTEEIHRLTSLGDAKSFIWLNDHHLLFPALRNPKDKERAKKGERITAFNRICIRGGEAVEAFKVPYTVTGFKKIDDEKYALICRWHPEDPDFATLNPAEKAEAFKRIEEEKDYEVLDEIPFWSNGGGFVNKRRSRLYIFDSAQCSGEFVTGELTNVQDFKVQKSKIAYTATTYKDKMEMKTGAYEYDIEAKETKTLLEPGILRLSFIDFYKDGYMIKGSEGKTYGNGEYGKFFTLENGTPKLFCEIDEAAGNFTNSDCRYGGGTTLKIFKDEIYYTCVDHVENALRKITAEGKVETILQQKDSFDGFDICERGLLWFGLGAVTLQEIYKLDGGFGRKISNFNGDFLAKVKLNTPERCDAMGEWDTVEGFVIKPIDFDPNKKYPCVLNIHGGPKTAFGDTYFHENHLYSAMGYFVIICNPWGSDGRGDKFADLRGRYGTVDYNDLMAFTDTCIKEYPQIDDKRVCVTGGSYGGFMTNWIIGHTDRFCCAASQRSISNWISKFGTTDIGYYFNSDQQQSTPWDNQEKMWWHSPMKYADKCVTPTLFIHSEEDYRCWVAEGLQMFTSLKYHGCEARLCMFRKENHELSRSGAPKHRVRRLKEMTDWFEKYAK